MSNKILLDDHIPIRIGHVTELTLKTASNENVSLEFHEFFITLMTLLSYDLHSSYFSKVNERHTFINCIFNEHTVYYNYAMIETIPSTNTYRTLLSKTTTYHVTVHCFLKRNYFQNPIKN